MEKRNVQGLGKGRHQVNSKFLAWEPWKRYGFGKTDKCNGGHVEFAGCGTSRWR